MGDPVITFLTICPREMGTLATHNSGRECSQAAWLTTARYWKQPKCPSGGEWSGKLVYALIMEHYPGIKRSELSIHAITPMDSKAKCRVREDNLQRLYALGFHLVAIPEWGRLQGWRTDLCHAGRGRGVDVVIWWQHRNLHRGGRVLCLTVAITPTHICGKIAQI